MQTRYFPSLRTEIYVLQAQISVPRDGRLSKRETIFRPSPTEKKDCADAIFHLPLTKKETI